MAFTIKTWVDRLAEFPNRRRLEPTGIENTYDVVRAEGNVAAEGDKFDAATMNDLEQRIAAGFSDTVQGATVGGVVVPKNGTTLDFPAYPTSLPANGGHASTADSATYANSAGSATYSTHAVGSGSAALRNITASTSGPSGGSDGDVWLVG